MKNLVIFSILVLMISVSGCGGGTATSDSTDTTVTATNLSVSGKVDMPNNGQINIANYSSFPTTVNRISINDELDKFKVTAQYNNTVKTVNTDSAGKYSFQFESGKGDLLLTAQFIGANNRIKLMKRIASPGAVTKTDENIDSESTAMELCYAKLRQTNDFDYSYMTSQSVKTLYADIKDSLEVVLLNGTTAETILKDDKINSLVVIASNNLIPQLVPLKPENIVVTSTDPITFTWTEVERAMTYEVYLNDQQTAYKSVIENQASLENLQEGNHTIWLKSVNVFGKSAFSDSRQIIK